MEKIKRSDKALKRSVDVFFKASLLLTENFVCRNGLKTNPFISFTTIYDRREKSRSGKTM